MMLTMTCMVMYRWVNLLTKLESEEAVTDCLMRVMAILRISTALS